MGLHMVEERTGYSLPDGDYWSPDCGAFVARGDKLYHETGKISENCVGAIRLMPGGYTCSEDYSLWTDERRQKEIDKRARAWNERMEKERLHQEDLDRRVAAAEAKLTKEDIDAMKEAYHG